ncbi:MAG TPA: hypothetical protein VG122_07165 [Gemmata sp.]|jgi:hypothetical protein|nr:hypothetical protein [Gemmata sp.]
MGNGVESLPCDQILAVAHADAARVYRDLFPYRIQLVLENDGWHVDYELKDPRLKGGGPHYIIDAQQEPSSQSDMSNDFVDPL